ncbi:MAG: hypothetical protein JSV20_04035 [Candidatus Bathyarchaeota archaeon]|nr:MAG: hypothetical protein JSV20_04035 [Candidatus Bathyarchaeota archaeon]
MDQLTNEISGDIAKEYVSGICNHHRIQGSPGLLSAIKYVVRTLKDLGLTAKVRKYPADG